VAQGHWRAAAAWATLGTAAGTPAGGEGEEPAMAEHLVTDGRRVGWLLAGLVALVCAWIMPVGNVGWPVVLEVAAVALVILLAPPSLRGAGPVALILLGLAGILLTLSDHAGIAARAVPGPQGGFVSAGYVVDGRAEAWHTVLLVQSVALLAVGAWLIWANGRRLLPAPADLAAFMALWARPGRLAMRVFPVTAAILVLLIDHGGSHPAWGTAGSILGLSLLLGWLFPRLGADLAAVAAIVLAAWGTGDATAPPPTIGEHNNGYPSLLAIGADWRMALLGAVEAGVIVAYGAWLLPRTIVAHGRSVLRPAPDPELAGRVQQLTRTRADAVDTAAAELRRVERDLHDWAQARLVALGMNLRAAERLVTTSPEAAIALIAEARQTSSRALTELRDLVRGIYPPVLADRGLGAAVQALALDTPMRVETDIDLAGRVDAPVESACYFAVAEALANAVKHSGARVAQIRIRFTPDHPESRARRGAGPGMLRIEVTDNGTGGADPVRGSGLQGSERRRGT
jgi:signal transduction histidine kinase